ncbi:fibrocystin isoform X2 [Paroedura picta]|uniref:fibrocystin isoform X2 n=1 Tax=Paroedura picta TaxID=143630 RepID=UPI00405617D9
MNSLLPSSLKLGLLFLAVALAKLITEPEYGSIGGGTWITITVDSVSINVSQLEVVLVNPVLPTVLCDLEPLSCHQPIVKCQTRSARLEGLYHPQFILNGQVANTSSHLHCDSCTFQFSVEHTPIVYRVDPPCGVPGNVIQIYGRILTSKYETYDFNVDFIDGPVTLKADGWITLCSLADRQTHSIYSIQTSHGLGTLGCRVEGNYIGSHNVSFSVFNKGKSLVHKDAWLISAKQELFLYQTFPEISSVFPAAGSLGGGTLLTISGDFFDTPVRVTVAGTPCQIKHVSPQMIICTTGPAGEDRCPRGPQPGNRGLLFEVWEGTDTGLGEAAANYRWQIVPNASSPLDFLPGRQQLFRVRLRGFFVAPQTNNYTFWIQADANTSLYFSLSEDPWKKVEVASIPDGILGGPTNWEENGSRPWNLKSEKFELTGGSMYYLEAVHHGKSPSRGMRIGVQVHNTWLNPDVVNTYRRERHEIVAHSSRLPEIQMLTLSGSGRFSLAWNNVTSNVMSTNVTAKQVQEALEDLLSIKCEMKRSSANILLQTGFEHGNLDSMEKFTRGGCPVSWTEPFCGRFSAHQLESLFKIHPPASAYDVTKYTHLCFAHKGSLSNTLSVAVSYSATSLRRAKKNVTCQWPLTKTNPESWKFVCTDLWRDCLENSESLKDLQRNSSVFLHQIDIEPLASVADSSIWFFVDEIIVSDTDIVVFQKEARPPHLHCRHIESVSVVGTPPIYNVSLLAADCCKELPLVSLRGFVGEASVSLTVQRVQMASPPLGGTFRIHLPNVVISGVPVSISSQHLHRLLQSHTNNFTAQYLNISDFLVTKDSSSCYQSRWTLIWLSTTGDLPDIINVSAENLTGLNPAVTSRVVFDGGVFITPIFGDMLATPNDFTQVAVSVNDVPANCSGSCIFQYLLDSTPLVDSVQYSVEDAVHMLIRLEGSGFTADRRLMLIEVNQMDCEILASNHSSTLCWMNLLPAGLYRITVLVRHYGFAVNASGEGGIFLRIMPRLTAIEPPVASEIGGLPVTLTGSGFDGISLVVFGSQPCPINARASNATVIECWLPPWRGEDHVVNLTLASGCGSALFPDAFMYDASLNPFIISLSRNTSGTAGGSTLSIGMSSFANYTKLDVKVAIQDSVAEIQAQTRHGLHIVLPSLTRGLYHLSVFLNNILIGAEGVELSIQYVTEVFQMEPCCGSLLGGTLVTMSGTGFINNRHLVSIFVGSQPCPVSYLNEEKIVCHSPPVTQLSNATVRDLSANVQLFIGNRSSVDASVSNMSNFSFLYKTSLTLNIVGVEVEMANGTLGLKVEVDNTTDLVALLGSVKCELKIDHTNHSTVCAQCSLPLNVFEPGQYPIRVLQKQMGYANIKAAKQSFTVVPLIKTIFPSHGSVCGGQLLTISGLNLKSQTNSSRVNLTGNFTCEIQSSNDTVIRCAVLRRDLPMHSGHFCGGSQDLGVTVTLNGIISHCLGECLFHQLKNLTFIIDAVTVEFSELLIHLLIRAQSSTWTKEETSIEVDSYFPCNITFWNETRVECQLNSLAAGDHIVSVQHRKWGQACLRRKGSNVFRIDSRVLQYHPQNFSINGGGLLTLQGIAVKGRDKTSIVVGNHHCFLTSASFWTVQCLVPSGHGITTVRLYLDGILYFVAEINYSKNSTPVFLSLLPPVNQFLTIRGLRIRQAEDMYVSIGGAACNNVTGDDRTLQCVIPRLPAGTYSVTGGDVLRGRASSGLTFTSLLTIVSVTRSHAGLGGGEVHLRGTGFSPGNTSVTICGTLCKILDDVTTTDLSCLAPPLNASLAVLCGLTWSLEEKSDCPAPVPSLIQCDIHVTANTSVVIATTPYLYFCDDFSTCFSDWAAVDSSSGFFSGLFISPKVERDEVLIYNSSCNITMETEAEMECEGPNQPITAKITEIWKKPGQNTQSAFRLCGYWSKHWSWLGGQPPHDGDNVTVERSQTLLLDTSTSILNVLHVKGGKLVFVGPGPVELHAHYILVSDGGELRIGSSGDPFCGIAHIHLHGSSHTPLFSPYGAKFLAVRNGTLSIHGCVPKATITHLKLGARPNDTKLSLVDPVDWKPGDEAVVCGGGLGDSQKQEELITVKSVKGQDLFLTSPLRYPHGISEEPVLGERLNLRTIVALLSRNVVIRGNVTSERISHQERCKEAGVSWVKREVSKCLYKTSERKLGSRDMGAVVLVQSYHGEGSQVHLQGVRFQHVGQAFRKDLSALTITGNADMTNSYIRNCVVSDSFARGISFSGVSHIQVEHNILYNIKGHGIQVGERLDQKNQLKHNTIIGLSGTDGLSNIETFSPAGIYIQAPDNLVEGNVVCAAGHGYFFHLSLAGPSRVPILSFRGNMAHSCRRYGLLVYPEYHPQRANSTIPVVFQSFTAWQCLGGVQIMSSSNLQLRAFRICACHDFGADIVESLGNTSVVDSLFLGRLHEMNGSCMFTGLKTPKRRELWISNATFVNFDIRNCRAIAPCSGCQRGQGGFTVRAEGVLLLNAPNWVSFSFPHSAILEDLDGSITGLEGSRLLPSMDTLPTSCWATINTSQPTRGSICAGSYIFHRMSIGLKASVCPYNLKVTDSRNKTTTVNYVHDTLSNAYGWMAILLDQETYTLSFDSPLASVNLQYVATFDNFTAGNFLLVEHEGLSPHINVTVTCGIREGSSLQSLPSHRYNKSCDWVFRQEERKLTYLDPPPPSPPPPYLRWSLPASWDGVPESWGGYNNSIPLAGDDVIILPGKTILVDTTLPRLRGLYILGTLEFPSNASNVLSACCILIVGGVLKVGTLENPLERGAKLQIVLRASEKVPCDRLEGTGVPPGTVGVHGKLQMHSAYTTTSWTRLGNDVAPGNERFWVQDALDWHPNDSAVISSSSYEAHQAEMVTLEEVSGHSIRIHERLLYRHLGHSHRLEDGQPIPLAAEFGLLTRNIQIKTDSHCTGRLLVGSFRNASGTEYTGMLQLSNVEIISFGSSQFPAVDITSTSSESFIISSSIHQSCGVGIQAVASSGLSLRDNVVFSTAGHGIYLEGQGHSLLRNLVVLSKQPEGASSWVAGIKTTAVDNAHLHDNVVAGSERIAFHIRGQGCFSAGEPCSGNVAHSSLHGVHLDRRDSFPDCTRITGFLSYKNYDYGVIFHLEGNVVVENLILVDNNVGLLPVLFCSSTELRCHLKKQHVELRNSVLLATSSSFDCIKDRIHPLSAQPTMRDRAPRSPWKGRVGILWPSFTSEPRCWPEHPWHKIQNHSAVLGIMKLQGVTFAGFQKTCYSDDRDICIMASPENRGVMHVVTAERTRMLHVDEQNMFHFYPLQTGENESSADWCIDGVCEGSRKALFKDLDGSTLGLDPPASVFPRSESEWKQPCLDAGIYREDRKCVYKASVNGYFCRETSHAMVVLESIGTSASHMKFPPPVVVTGTFVDIFSDVISSPQASQHSSIFYSVLPSNKLSKICFASPVARSLKLYVNNGHNATRILLAIFYDEPRSFRVFAEGKYIPPAPSSSFPPSADAITGTNYFNFQENLLYVAICQEDSIEIHTWHSLQIAFTVPGAESQAMAMERLADFLQIAHSQIRIVHDSPGSENTLKIIADNAAKRKHQCSTMKTCMVTRHRAGQQRNIRGSMGSSQRSLPGTGLRLLILEISDPPSFLSDGPASLFSSERLNSLANILANAQQVGELQRALQFPVDSFVVTVFAPSTSAEGNSRNGSSGTGRTCLYIRPYNLSLWIQPSDGVVGRPLPRKPQVVFLDKQGQRVLMLGFPSKSWIVAAHLQGDLNVALKGSTQEEVQHGRATFQNLIISSSCFNCCLIFKVISPPGAALSVTSNFFTIRPVAVTEKSAIIFTAALGSAASVVVLGSVVLCWFKKSKRNKKHLKKQTLKDKKFPQIQMNHRASCAHSHGFGEEKTQDLAARREGMRIHKRVEYTAEPSKKLPHQALHDASTRRASHAKQDPRPCGGNSSQRALALQQLSTEDRSQRKVTHQYSSDYGQETEAKERQLAEEGPKRDPKKPVPRPGRGMRGRQETAVARRANISSMV